MLSDVDFYLPIKELLTPSSGDGKGEQMTPDVNWYVQLKELDANDHIIALAVTPKPDEQETKFFASVEEARVLLDYTFNPKKGNIKGVAFTAWSDNNVYFPVCYGGAERISCVPRNPVCKATTHQGVLNYHG
jgi:hypothetical protein